MHDQIMAGRAPGPPAAEAIAELDTIERELALVGLPEVRGWVSPEITVLHEAVETPAILPSVVFYGDLVVERLKVLTEGEPYNSAASHTAKHTAEVVRNLARWPQYGQTDPELDQTVRAVRSAVALADLFRLREKEESTIASLEAAKVGR